MATVFSGFDLLLFIIIFPVFTFYNLIFEVYNNGQSIGKMLLKIRVVTVKGKTPSLIDYFTRWIFRTVDIAFSFGVLAISFVTSTDKNQRIGDIFAKTSVVKTKNEYNISLSSINKEMDHKEILFPEVTQFTDEDMLLIKQTILRRKRFPNESNDDIISDISKNLKSKLKAKKKFESDLKFLERILYEYIILTR